MIVQIRLLEIRTRTSGQRGIIMLYLHQELHIEAKRYMGLQPDGLSR